MAEKMKPSGIDWIGDIPNNWETSRIKYHYQISLGKMLQPIQENSTDTLEHYMCSANITWAGVDTSILKQMWFSPAEKKQYRLLDGDLLVSEGGDVAVSCIWRNELDECYLQNAVHRVRQNALSDNRFIYYWLFFLKNYGIVDLICNKATIAHFTKEKFGELPICIMSIDEQVAIADFLDKECAQIDSIAADLEKQIALLQQYKKSLITETVTKGLDKSVPMKDSGVEWIGEIPVGWELSRIKYLTDNHHPYPIGDGDHGMIKADDYLTEGIPYIRVLNLTWGSGLNLENLVFISKEMNSLIKNSELKPNDILIAKTGATIGKTAIVPDSLPVSNTTSHVGKITLANVHDAKYFYYVMTSSIVQKQIQDISAMQSTRPELGIEGLKNLILTVPLFDIQQHIARFLDDHCAKIDRVLHEKCKQLSVIKQHKKSLIYEYVTGKKRVKEVR